MDTQLLMRLDRMAPPRLLILSADVAAAKRLVEGGLIEATLQARTDNQVLMLHAMYVLRITPRGLSAVAQEKVRWRHGGHRATTVPPAIEASSAPRLKRPS
ncbi:MULTISPECIES: hypothetical protein [Variovorax]|uniref:hypothetical protein n=1 Tax=Variovorax TaxID=34072 RepID=UPI00248113C1|nr:MULTISPECIES: hypothetical protein [Variovorax]MDR6890807.1 hypothetical protein [Variovorax sp. 3319]WGT62460.1 hypothetical protein QHG62_20730 [Variovorax paradoxus]